MRWLWIILAALLIIVGVGPLTFGQDYPTRPIRFITPAQPGGTNILVKFLHADVAKWAKIVKDSGAKVD